MSTATTLAVVPAEYDTFTQAQLDLIKTTLAPGLTNNELALYIEVAKRTGLDPLSRQIYAIKRGDKMTIQTGIDGYRAIASRSGLLAGIDDATYDTEEADHPGRASCTVWRFALGQRVPFTATARWSEYKPAPPNDRQWGKMPYLMLGKCAEALALRKAFPVEISGVYTADEMAQAENDSAPAVVPADTTEQQQHTTLPDCGEFAKDHDIPGDIFKRATRKYNGRWDDLMTAMRSYVAARDADAAARAANEAAEAREESQEDMSDLPVGARGN